MDSVLGINWFLILLSAIPLVYWYFARSFNYWSKRGIKGPTPLPGVGTLLYQFITPRPLLENSWFKKYGRVYGLYDGNEPALVVGEPELIKTILVKDFHLFMDRGAIKRLHPIIGKALVHMTGDEWKRVRTVMSPTFTSGKMKKMYPMVKQTLEEFLDALDQITKNGKADLDAKAMFGKYTMDTIATCAFATRTNAYEDDNSPFLKNASKVFQVDIWRQVMFTILPKVLLKPLGLATIQEESVNEFFFGMTRHILQERKNNKLDNSVNDFIDLVLAEERDNKNRKEAVVRDADDINESHHVNEGEEELNLEKKLYNGVSKRYITEEEIIAQSWLFFLAGYETTANTISFAAYQLAINEDIQQRLYEEVMTAVDTNGDIDYYCLSRLPYLDSVISETLRYNGPVLNLPRTASQDYKLGNTGITLKKGQMVYIPVYAVHHSEEFYEDPFKFNPDRFMPENRNKIKPYTYLPFGGGPRNCIGMRFALMEAKLGLAQMIRRFKLSKSPETDVPLKLGINPAIRLNKRVIISIERRV